MTCPNVQAGGKDAEHVHQEVVKSLPFQRAFEAIVRISLDPWPLDEQLRRVLESLFELPWLASESKGCVFLVEEDPPVLVMMAQVGLPEEVRSRCARVEPGFCLCGRAFATNRVVFSDHLAEDHIVQYPGMTPHGNYCVPIASADRPLGLLNVRVDGEHVPSREEVRFLQTVAGILAGLIIRRRLEGSLRDSEERFDLVIRAIDAGVWDWNLQSGEIQFSPRWKSMLGHTPEEISTGFDEWASRLHPDERERALAAIDDYLAGRIPDYIFEHRLRHKDGSYRWILARAAKSFDESGRLRRVVGSHEDRTLGKDVEEELKRRQGDLFAAQKIIRHLLPRVPLCTPNIEVVGSSFAADYASGDFFDYFCRPDGTMMVAIADVSGHGIDAALLMAATHARVHAYAELSLKLGDCLNRLNDALLAQVGQDDRFVTLMLLAIDPWTRTLTYSSAGHPPGFILGRDGEVRAVLGSQNLPLALERGLVFPVTGPILLQSGDLILLLTDGAFEPFNSCAEQYGMDRVLELVRDHIDAPCETIIDNLFGAIRDFTGLPFLHDDVTCVIIRVA